MSLLISAQALAADNTVTFLGEVTSETCTVAINGNKVSPVVLLPSVNKSELLTAGSVAKPTTFDISVSGCTGNPAQQRLFPANLQVTASPLAATWATWQPVRLRQQMLKSRFWIPLQRQSTLRLPLPHLAI
jgi:type 1 fimbria pilin